MCAGGGRRAVGRGVSTPHAPSLGAGMAWATRAAWGSISKCAANPSRRRAPKRKAATPPEAAADEAGPSSSSPGPAAAPEAGGGSGAAAKAAKPKAKRAPAKPKAPAGPLWDASMRAPPLPEGTPACRILSWNVAGLRVSVLAAGGSRLARASRLVGMERRERAPPPSPPRRRC